MFKEKTVFVLGAGSSKEVGMPLGSELKQKIVSMYAYHNHNGEIFQARDKIADLALRQVFKEEKIFEIFEQFNRALQTVDSIDDYLARFPNDSDLQLCAKVGIVSSIINSEKNSYLSNPVNIGVNGTWLPLFLKNLTRQVSVEAVDDYLFNNLTIINFNYDRCLERYLSIGLSDAYSRDLMETSQWVKRLRILRPYGSIGSFWKDDENYIEFGELGGSEKLRSEKLVELSKGILTYSEKSDQKELYREIRESIFQATNVIFLGFGFHEQNMDLIKPKTNAVSNNHRNIFSTMLGISENDQARLEIDLKTLVKVNRLVEVNVFKEAVGCFQLFQNNRFGF